MPKRILMTSWLAGAGGNETHLLNLSRLLVSRGAEVTIATRLRSKTVPLVQQRREIPVRLIDTPFAGNRKLYRLSTAWALLVWPALLAGRKFDALYTFDVSPFTAFLAKFVRRNGYVIHGRGGPSPAPGERLDPIGIRRLDAMIVETRRQALETKAAFGLAIPVAAIPMLGFCSNPPKRGSNIATPGKIAGSDRLLRVAFLGRFDRPKGVFRLLDVWDRLAIGPARLDYYGYGPEKAALQSLISQRELDGQIKVNPGWTNQQEYERILEKVDLVVLPSESEGLPVVLLEAMARGIPFAAGDVGAVPTLAEENPHVRVFPLGAGGMKTAIEQLAAGIREGRLGGQALQKIHDERFGYEKISKMWADALLRPQEFWKAGAPGVF